METITILSFTKTDETDSSGLGFMSPQPIENNLHPLCQQLPENRLTFPEQDLKIFSQGIFETHCRLFSQYSEETHTLYEEDGDGWKRYSSKLRNFESKLRPQRESFRRNYSLKEDLMIAKFAVVEKLCWSMMMKKFDTRTSTMLKNRYHSYVKKKQHLTILLQILKDLEQAGPIETYTDEIIDDFKIFLPQKKVKAQDGNL